MLTRKGFGGGSGGELVGGAPVGGVPAGGLAAFRACCGGGGKGASRFSTSSGAVSIVKRKPWIVPSDAETWPSWRRLVASERAIITDRSVSLEMPVVLQAVMKPRVRTPKKIEAMAKATSVSTSVKPACLPLVA